jgi:hypothetical protein
MSSSDDDSTQWRSTVDINWTDEQLKRFYTHKAEMNKSLTVDNSAVHVEVAEINEDNDDGADADDDDDDDDNDDDADADDADDDCDGDMFILLPLDDYNRVHVTPEEFEFVTEHATPLQKGWGGRWADGGGHKRLEERTQSAFQYTFSDRFFRNIDSLVRNGAMVASDLVDRLHEMSAEEWERIGFSPDYSMTLFNEFMETQSDNNHNMGYYMHKFADFQLSPHNSLGFLFLVYSARALINFATGRFSDAHANIQTLTKYENKFELIS